MAFLYAKILTMLIKRFSIISLLLSLTACKSVPQETKPVLSWCPQGISSGPMRIEGIVDYENINWCKVVIELPDAKTEIYYTQDGIRQRVVQYSKGVRRNEVEIRKSKTVVRIYDEKGNLVEEVKGKEFF